MLTVLDKPHKSLPRFISNCKWKPFLTHGKRKHYWGRGKIYGCEFCITFAPPSGSLTMSSFQMIWPNALMQLNNTYSCYSMIWFSNWFAVMAYLVSKYIDLSVMKPTAMKTDLSNVTTLTKFCKKCIIILNCTLVWEGLMVAEGEFYIAVLLFGKNSQ